MTKQITQPNLLQLEASSFRDILNAIPDPVMIKDAFQRLVFLNAAYYKEFGPEERSVYQSKRSDIYPEELALNTTTAEVTNEESIDPKDKNSETFSVFSSLIEDRSGQQYFVSVFQKRSKGWKMLKDELGKAKKQLAILKDSNAQLENFAYIASHDLREPLRTIGEFTQLLRRRLDNVLTSETNEFMDFITDGVKNMNLLINDLLKYSRVNTDPIVQKELEPEILLTDVINSFGKVIQETGAKIEFEDMPDKIIGSYGKLKQLLQNLLANAIKFRKPESKPEIYVSCKEEDSGWLFAIKDNGIGIKEEFYEKIFHLFRKLHSKYQYEGSGIGLAICKKIIEQHEGKIWLESNFGKGSTFYFWLPNPKL